MSNAKIHFLGASRTVTGSKYLIETQSINILVDCGLFQGKKEIRERNWKPFPFPADKIDAVVLTHAHLDHTGYLPRLVKQGFTGPIYCTEPTSDLTKILLLDSAKLQEEEANFANKHKTSKHHPALPLYDENDVNDTIGLLKSKLPHREFEISKGISIRFDCAGHILGAAIVTLKIDENRSITFSGDIGRYGAPLLEDPEPVKIGNILVCESTYGDRLHSIHDSENDFANHINEGIKMGGPILIPSFSIGRAQHLLYLLSKLERDGKIPEIPVFLDSPMAIDSTDIYKKYRHYFDSETKDIMQYGDSVLRTKQTYFTRSHQDSVKLNSLKGPRIIIAGSGMATGGRILHHFMHWLSNGTTTVIFVGFQAEGTRGQRLLAGEKTIRIFGKDIPSRAKILNLPGLSAHGDKKELTRWLSSCSGTPTKVKIVHGESHSAEHFATHLRETFKWDATPAEPDECIEF